MGGPSAPSRILCSSQPSTLSAWWAAVVASATPSMCHSGSAAARASCTVAVGATRSSCWCVSCTSSLTVRTNPIDPDVKDVYDFSLLEKGNEVWNTGGMVNWPLAYDALHGTIYGGMPRDEWNDQRAIGE